MRSQPRLLLRIILIALAPHVAIVGCEIDDPDVDDPDVDDPDYAAETDIVERTLPIEAEVVELEVPTDCTGHLQECHWQRTSVTSNSSTVWTGQAGCYDGYIPVGAGCSVDNASARLVASYPFMERVISVPYERIYEVPNECATHYSGQLLGGDSSWRCAAYLPNGATLTTTISCCSPG